MQSVLILSTALLLISIQATNQTTCNDESKGLKGTAIEEKFIQDCLESSPWSVTLDKEAAAWEKCKEKLKFSNHQECLNNNRIYKKSMIPAFDCYYEELGVLSNKGYNKYRYSKSDSLYYNISEQSLYQTYSKCLNGKLKLENSDESVKFYDCVAEDISEESSNLMLQEWKQSPNYKEDFEECKKTLDKDLADSFNLKISLKEEFLPYIQCLFGRMGLFEGYCLLVDRVKSTFNNNENVRKCFIDAAGDDHINYISFWNCLVEKNVFNKFVF